MLNFYVDLSEDEFVAMLDIDVRKDVFTVCAVSSPILHTTKIDDKEKQLFC